MISTVPEYNITIPVDHFDASNTNKFTNRYFVNDTYYKPGGPIILYDHGEATLSPAAVNAMLGGKEGRSLAMEMARELHGLVIAWEHRYYGQSLPVFLDESTGLPEQGAWGYRYLSAELALEDVVYFANNFNLTNLHLNSVVQDTSGLDPYNSPWIFVGASYAGTRAAWLRAKHPEIIYAAYASSAPLEFQEDGSSYFNAPVRSMPKSCSDDIKAAVKYFDETMTSGKEEDCNKLKSLVFETLGRLGLPASLTMSDFDMSSVLAHFVTLGSAFQYFGPEATTDKICKRIKEFDAERFQEEQDKNRDDADNVYRAPPNAGGEIAVNNKKRRGLYAFAAWMSAVRTLGEEDSNTDELRTNKDGDYMSWVWQVASEIGLLAGSSDEVTVVSRLYNVTAVRDIEIRQETFARWPMEHIPPEADFMKTKGLGGWNMRASNTLFTNGEIDPWTAFSVASKEVGAPFRKIVQTVPRCNRPPPGSDVFGLVFPKAVHAADFEPTFGATNVYDVKPSQRTPLQHGLALFLEAWKVWAPCFNESRDLVRDDGEDDGEQSNANLLATHTSRTVTAAVLLGVLCALL